MLGLLCLHCYILLSPTRPHTSTLLYFLPLLGPRLMLLLLLSTRHPSIMGAVTIAPHHRDTDGAISFSGYDLI